MTPVRFLVPVALVLSALTASTAERLEAQNDPDKPVAGGGTLPAGWHAQADWSMRTNSAPPLDNVKFSVMGSGYHATTGPAAIFWREADRASGNYRVVASIAQIKNPEHPEAYGIFIGGRDLAGDGQTYTYFLVRAYDGKFSIRRRGGRTTRPTAVVEWTAHEAVRKADASSGRAENELSIIVERGQVKFLINGKEVHSTGAADLDTQGIVGYRVNHNLDVRLGPLGVHASGG
jgi:hypothetical protein